MTQAEGDSSADRTSPAFLADVETWVQAQLTALHIRTIGPLVSIHDRPWSTVLRVATDRGEVFVKASASSLRHEAAITDFIARRRPDLVPPPLAIDPDRGWLLMADAGTRLRDLVDREHDVSRWLDVLPAFAGLQRELAGEAAALIALGAPDLRLAVLPGRFHRLLDELEQEVGDSAAEERTSLEATSRRSLLDRAHGALPRVATMCEELAAVGIPETIQHDDLNDAAIYLSDDGYKVLDWGDACVSHPFFSMSVALEGVIAWGVDDVEGSVDITPFRDAYLTPYAAGHDLALLRSATALAIRLGWACRSINGHVPGPEAAATWTRLRMFLDGRPA